MPRISRRAALTLSVRASLVLMAGPSLASAGWPARPVVASARQHVQTPLHVAQAQLDAYIQERMTAWSVPGLALSIVEGGRVTVTQGYGLADREQSRPMTPQTPVAVGSTTKPLTAAAIMQLVEAGAVELDARVTQYLPWFTLDDPRSTEITVRQLLNHTSGIPASASLDGRQEPDALERRVRSLEWERLSSTPGTRFEYSNDGFNTAGLIVQVVSGLPYEQYMTQKLLGPLGMTRSTFDPARAAELGLAQGYLKRKGQLRPEKTRLTRSYNPAGMLLTTAEDSGRFLAAMLEGGQLDGVRVVSEPSVALMQRESVRINDTLAYGLGWFLSQQDGVQAALHPGEILTMGSMFVLAPERKLGVAVLANLDSDAKDEIAEGVARLLIGFQPVLRDVPRIGPDNPFVPNRAVRDAAGGAADRARGRQAGGRRQLVQLRAGGDLGYEVRGAHRDLVVRRDGHRATPRG
jgi:CubicO group peptidase (beta-lactamase class C family)